MMERYNRKSSNDSFGWIGFGLPFDAGDEQLTYLRDKFHRKQLSHSMNKFDSFDRWIEFCSAVTCNSILKIMKKTKPGVEPLCRETVCKMVRNNRERLRASGTAS